MGRTVDPDTLLDFFSDPMPGLPLMDRAALALQFCNTPGHDHAEEVERMIEVSLRCGAAIEVAPGIFAPTPWGALFCTTEENPN